MLRALALFSLIVTFGCGTTAPAEEPVAAPEPTVVAEPAAGTVRSSSEATPEDTEATEAVETKAESEPDTE